MRDLLIPLERYKESYRFEFMCQNLIPIKDLINCEGAEFVRLIGFVRVLDLILLPFCQQNNHSPHLGQ